MRYHGVIQTHMVPYSFTVMYPKQSIAELPTQIRSTQLVCSNSSSIKVFFSLSTLTNRWNFVWKHSGKKSMIINSYLRAIWVHQLSFYHPYLYHGHLTSHYINLNLPCLHSNLDNYILHIGGSGALRGPTWHLVAAGKHHTQGEEYRLMS